MLMRCRRTCPSVTPIGSVARIAATTRSPRTTGMPTVNADGFDALFVCPASARRVMRSAAFGPSPPRRMPRVSYTARVMLVVC